MNEYLSFKDDFITANLYANCFYANFFKEECMLKIIQPNKKGSQAAFFAKHWQKLHAVFLFEFFNTASRV